MSDLLKEAIADAKAVRETALANAKMALEEAFTPHLKSMLSAKLAEDEYEEDEEDIAVDDEDAEEMARSQYREDDDEDMDIEPEDGEAEEYEEGISEEDIIEIDGVKYAPIVTEEDEEEDEDENPFAKDDEVEESEELDLEAVIKELEDELSEDEEVEEDESVNEVEDEDLDEYKGTRAEKRKESGNAPRINNEEVEEELTESDPDEEEVVKEDSEKVDEDEEKDETNESETSELQNELTEYKEAVTFLRDKLHEVNILNAKLLYTNKLFKEYVLSNDQKLKIVETFDRAQTTREIKLVYTTLAESFKPGEGEKKNEVVKEFASKKSGGTAPKTKIITEESQVADRFRKLAGIL
jgi:hypothetical protein